MAQPVGFFTDTTLCIGCKACEVACKEWNQLPNNPLEFRDSYDNTGQLDHANWRHVRFVEQPTKTPDKPIAWSMMSDVCKHCANASCLEVCPTDAIVRTEFDTVFIQQDVCNGCRDCISACPSRGRGGPDRMPPPRRHHDFCISLPLAGRGAFISLPTCGGGSEWGVNAQRAFRRSTELGVVHPSLLLLCRARRRRICDRYDA